MKTLYLVRHAKAVKCNSDLPDVERKLSKKGRNAARKMAKKLKRNDVVPDLLISSPAKRAHETACIFAKTINYPVGTIVIIEALAQEQGASNEAGLLTLVRDVDNQYQSAMIFGLDQQISGFARVLGNDFTEALPSCSVVRFDFRNRSWDKISQGKGLLKFVDYRGREKRVKAKMEKELKMKIACQLQQTFGEMNADAANKMKKAIGKSTKDLSEKFLVLIKSTKAEKKGKNEQG